MAPYTPGCVFEYFGRVPESVYTPEEFRSPLEEAVYINDIQLFNTLVQKGEEVSVRLKIGQMSCIEYAAMKGYTDVLNALISNSVCADILKKYFQMEDVVERAYLISKNKSMFFGISAGLAEANRYLAALYTSVVYNQPKCTQLMLSYLGKRDLARKSVFETDESTMEMLDVEELAQSLGHIECQKMIAQWQPSTDPAS